MVTFRALIEFERVFEEHLAAKRRLFTVEPGPQRPMSRRPIPPDNDPGPSRRPIRTGVVGMMAVNILWMGKTSSGVVRAKVQDSKQNSPPFWVDGWKVKTT